MNLDGIVDGNKGWWRIDGNKKLFLLAFEGTVRVKNASVRLKFTSGIKIVIDGETQL